MINQPTVGIIDANILFLWLVPHEHKPKTIKDYLNGQGIRNKNIVTRHEIMEALATKFELSYYPKNNSKYRHSINRIATWGLAFPDWIKDWNNPDSSFKASVDDRLHYLSTKKNPILKRWTSFGYGSSKGNYELVRLLTDKEKMRIVMLAMLPPDKKLKIPTLW